MKKLLISLLLTMVLFPYHICGMTHINLFYYSQPKSDIGNAHVRHPRMPMASLQLHQECHRLTVPETLVGSKLELYNNGSLIYSVTVKAIELEIPHSFTGLYAIVFYQDNGSFRGTIEFK